jgi:glycosyltransferase involved in cell wall biosynthesis
MHNKKTLMWMAESSLMPVGGPVGYLYNIFNEIQLNNIRSIDFLPPEQNIETLKSKIFTYLMKNVRYFKFYFFKSSLLKKATLPKDVNLSNYDVIHFHDTISLFKARNLIIDFNGKIILTSHSPEPLHEELINNNYSDLKLKQRESLYNILNFIDEYSFLRTDYIMFPCEEAKEPYNVWPFFKKIINDDKGKFLYCPTGTSIVTAKLDKDLFRQKHNIKNDAFVISYVGRHNSIKGYDTLKIMGEQILAKYPDVYFIIGGIEQPLKGLNHERWIEVGFTKDPHSLIAASDLFILPNKQTFFDLILLEVLALGTMVLASKTGGNKYFKKFENINMEYFATVEEGIDKISLLKKNNKYDREININLFKNNFLTSVFISKYEQIINALA